MLKEEQYLSRYQSFIDILNMRPHAAAVVKGSLKYPQIMGILRFYQTDCGVLVSGEIFGLPTGENVCGNSVFAIHIHEGDQCEGTESDPFADAMTHYNPENCPHPYHAGDLPPLFANEGYAFFVVLTNRFTVNEIIGKTVIIHADPDDFHTQPAGNAGEKIACGVIK